MGNVNFVNFNRSAGIRFNARTSYTQNIAANNSATVEQNANLNKKVSISDFNFSSVKETLGQNLADNKAQMGKFFSELNALSFNERGEITDFTDIDVEDTINKIAASYVGLKHKLENSSDGDKDFLLNELDTKFNNLLENKFAKYLATSGNNFFKEIGSSANVTAKFEQSILDVVHKRVDDFSKFIDSDMGEKFLEKVDLNKVSVADFSKVMAKNSSLIDQYAKENAPLKEEENAEVKDNGLFTLNDLKTMSTLEHKFRRMTTDNFIGKTEEQFGFELGMLSVGVKDALRENETSNTFSNLIENSFSSFTNNFLEKINKELEIKAEVAEDQFGSGDKYAPLDVKKIKGVIANTVMQYEAKGDATDAIINGFEYAKESALSRAQTSSAYRYSAGMDFFNNFYSQNLGNNYAAPQSEYQKYLKMFGIEKQMGM